ncbi:MAG: hypothetical protein OEY36_02415 [Gammaproteobacteria bacterium]|nr:hypothetical protein [Gammaproteobacteria bacterium]
MSAHDTQSFFTPNEYSRQSSRMLATTYNLAHVLLNRSQSSHVFVPIRSLQYLAIIEKQAFWFVDSLAYAVRGDEGGRLIRVSWHPTVVASERQALTQHMDYDIVFYGEDMSAVHNRLNNEFYQSMLQLDQRHRESLPSSQNISILPLNQKA